MNRIILFALILFIHAAAFSQAEKSQVYNDFIKVNENSKKIKDAKLKKVIEIANDKHDTASIYYYTPAGTLSQKYILKTDTTKENKNQYSITTYIYDADGKLSQAVDTLGKAIVKSLLFYDDLANISKLELYNAGGNLLKEISYENDELSRLTDATEINYMTKCKTKTHYANDSYNNITKVTIKNSCTDLGDKTTIYTYGYKYDKKYNIIEKLTKSPSGVTDTETFKYDAAGNLIESHESNGRDSFHDYIYTYDKSNNLIKTEAKETIADINTNYTLDMKYDKSGNVIEIQKFGPAGEVLSARTFIYETY